MVPAETSSDQPSLDPTDLSPVLAPEGWALLNRLPELIGLGRPVLVGASRKRFLGELLAEGDTPREVGDRDAATDAVSALAAGQGVWAVRVHDVRGSRDAVAVAAAWRSGGDAASEVGHG